MFIRESETKKFYLVPGSTEFFFELKTIGHSVREKAVSDAIVQKMRQPLSEGARKKQRESEDIEVEQKMRADLMFSAELKASIVGFRLPTNKGRVEDSTKKETSPGNTRPMTEDEMVEVIDRSSDDLKKFVSTAIDIMFGNIPDEKELAELAAIGITSEMLNISDADLTAPENPTSSGDSA